MEDNKVADKKLNDATRALMDHNGDTNSYETKFEDEVWRLSTDNRVKVLLGYDAETSEEDEALIEGIRKKLQSLGAKIPES